MAVGLVALATPSTVRAAPDASTPTPAGDPAPTAAAETPDAAPAESTAAAEADASAANEQAPATEPAPEARPDASDSSGPTASPEPEEPPPPDSAVQEPPAQRAAEESTPEEVAIPASDPPRINGAYVGLVFYGGISAARVNRLDTPGALSGGGAYLRFGQMVLPWLGFGLQGGGGVGVRSASGARQQLGQGALMVDLTFVPAPKKVRGLSLRASYGFGGGAIREEGVDARSGFGGSFFGAGGRYEFFPGAKNYRASRAGGFGIGPELGWIGATPAARGRPMAHTVYLGLSMAFYFGE